MSAATTTGTSTLLLRTCAAEWSRLWTVRTTWWFVVAATVGVLGLGTLLGFESASDPAALQGQPAWDNAQVLMMPAQLVLLGLVVLAVTADHATGGIVLSLQWTPRRTVLFVARALVTVTTATGLGVLLMVGAAVLADATAGSALTLPADEGVPAVGEVGLVLLAGSSLAVGLGSVLRSTAGALIAVFLLVVVLPLVLPLFGERVQELADALPGAGAIFLLTGSGDMSTTSSVVVLTAWAVGALVLGCLRLVRDDADR
ncbi:MAG: conserved rane protein of unknown function [Nocardioides sp.]|nr:conserved rane protein of unknown function [Nocardioides sp.]